MTKKNNTAADVLAARAALREDIKAAFLAGFYAAREVNAEEAWETSHCRGVFDQETSDVRNEAGEE